MQLSDIKCIHMSYGNICVHYKHTEELLPNCMLPKCIYTSSLIRNWIVRG